MNKHDFPIASHYCNIRMKTHVYCSVSQSTGTIETPLNSVNNRLINCSLFDDNLCLYGKEEIKPETFKTLTLQYNLIKIGSRRGRALNLTRLMPGCQNKL